MLKAQCLFVALAIASFAVSANAAEEWFVAKTYHVATNGNDSWTGRLEKPNADRRDGPFATIVGARDAIREFIKKENDPGGDVVVYIRGGEYRLDETVVFDRRDSRIAGRSVYRAYKDEEPIFHSDYEIKGWKKLAEAPADLPAAARGNVWVAEIPEAGGGKWRFKTLYQGDVRLPRARSEGFTPTRQTTAAEEYLKTDNRYYRGSTLIYPGEKVRNWKNLKDVELLARPSQQWIMNILPFEAVDEEKKMAYTSVSGTYPLAKCFSNPICMWIANHITYLDEPGEWALDTVEGKLYYWPIEGDKPGRVVAGKLIEYFLVEGDIDFMGPADTPVRFISFKGLTLTRGDRYTVKETDMGIQHDFEYRDQAGALIRFRGTEGCTVEDCHIYNSGGSAVRMDLHAQKDRVEGNDIHNMGASGILIIGYGPGTKNVSRYNRIQNNYIHECGELYWASTGIVINESGDNLISHNVIANMKFLGMLLNGTRHYGFLGERESLSVRWHEVEQVLTPEQVAFLKKPRYGTSVETNWYPTYTLQFAKARNNIIEYNDMFDLANFIGDSNAIYITAAGPGNVFRRNFVHHLYGRGHQMAVRCDGFQVDFTFEDNILWRCVFSGFANQGPNYYRNNIVADIFPTSYEGMQWSARCYIQMSTGSELAQDASAFERNIFYEPRKSAIFFDDQPYLDSWIEDCEVDWNLIYTAGDPSFSENYIKENQKLGVNLNGTSTDPMFEDVAKGDFNLKPDSPARALGFKNIPQAKIGLLPRFRRSIYPGKLMRTYISPVVDGPMKKGGELVTITCDQPNAEIHYTLDNTLPSRQSPLYIKPFMTGETRVIVRVRSFKEGYFDLYGDTTFYLSAYPIDDAFDDLALGASSLLAQSAENWDQREKGATISVVQLEDDADGDRCLQFIDIPGGVAEYNPHIFYTPPSLIAGTVTISYDLRLAPDSCVEQWSRDLSEVDGVTVNHPGPNLKFREGKLFVREKEVCEIPADTWVSVNIEVEIGEKAKGEFHIAITPEGQPTRKVKGLACDKDFRKLNWIGFSSFGNTKATHYLDSVRVDVK